MHFELCTVFKSGTDAATRLQTEKHLRDAKQMHARADTVLLVEKLDLRKCSST